MLSAGDRIGLVEAAAPELGRFWPAGASALLHAGLVGAALLAARPSAPVPTPPVEVMFLQQPAQVEGGAPTAPGAAKSPAPSLPAAEAGPRPAPPAPAAPRPAPPEVNLGSAPEDVAPYSASSPDLLPAAPDSRFRNLPPQYPAAAARVGAEGTVQLVVHVTEAGLAGEVTVARSSGSEALDQAARRAVLRWRFRPAQSNGQRVPFDYVLNVRFLRGAG